MENNDPIEIRMPWGQIIIGCSIFFMAVALFAIVMTYLENGKSEVVPMGMLRMDSLGRTINWKLDSMRMENGKCDPQ
jgi:hypothetical protein